MVVEEDRGVRHRGEADGGDPDLPEISGVRAGRKYLGLDVEAVLAEGPSHGGVPGVLGVHRGQSLVPELEQELKVNVGPSLAAFPRTA